MYNIVCTYCMIKIDDQIQNVCISFEQERCTKIEVSFMRVYGYNDAVVDKLCDIM